jgi:hypothetical protein
VNRIPLVLLAVPALGVARLLPADGGGLGCRIAAATGCLLIPGALISRALSLRGLAPVFAWSLAALIGALAVTFAVHGSLALTLALLGAVSVAALPFSFRQQPSFDRIELVVIVGGIALGAALWFVAVLDGDAFFHLARVRKLDDFGSLSLKNIGEFRDGSLHPGYAFPLWHAFLALVAKLGGADPIGVGRNAPTILAPLAVGLSYEAGRQLFRSAWAGIGVAVAQVAVSALAPGDGGSYTSLALPATASRQLVVPALLALYFSYVREPSRRLFLSTAAAGGAVALIHPTYALFIGIPLVGFVIARYLLVRGEVVPAAAGVLALAIPTALALAWLRPVVEATTSHDPSSVELKRAFAKYPGQLAGNTQHYHVTEQLFSRSGAVAVAALACVPLALLASRRRWAAWVLGASLAVFALTLIPTLFPHFANAVSISQARRFAGFVPFPFALAGGAAVLAGAIGILALPVALAAGIVLQLAYPGEFGYRFHATTPAWPAWLALAGGVAALVVGTFVRPRRIYDRRDWVAAAAVVLLALPVAVHAFRHWSRSGTGSSALTPGLIDAVRDNVRPKDVLFADPNTGYLLDSYAPFYLANAPFAHVAATKQNRPRQRLRDAFHFYAHGGDLEVPRYYGARWIVVDLQRHRLRLHLPRVYSDRRYVLYRLR